MTALILLLFLLINIGSAVERVCIAGGQINGGYANGNYTETTECFDESISSWVYDSNLVLPSPMHSNAAFSLGGIACFAGNSDLPFACSNGTAPWTPMPAPSVPRPGATALNGLGLIMLAGGGPTSITLSELPGSGGVTMSNINPYWFSASVVLFHGSTAAAALNFNDSLCMVGGSSSDTVGGSVSCICVRGIRRNITWFTGPLLTFPRYGATSLQMQGQACVVGGRQNSTMLSSIECASTMGKTELTDFIELLPSFPTTIADAVNISIHGLPCIAGGHSTLGVSIGTVRCFNNSNWIPFPSLNLPRREATSFTFTFNLDPELAITPTHSPTLSPTRPPTRSPTRSPFTLSPTTRSPSTLSPSTQSPTHSPSTRAPTIPSPSTITPTHSPTHSPSTITPTLNPTTFPIPSVFPLDNFPTTSSDLTRSPTSPPTLSTLPLTPEQGTAVVMLTINNITLNTSQALSIITQLFHYINITIILNPKDISLTYQPPSSSGSGGSGSSADGNPTATTAKTIISILISDESADKIGTLLTMNGGGSSGGSLQLDGYTVQVSLQFPSLAVELLALKPWQFILICCLLAVFFLILLVLHLIKQATSHLPCLFGVCTSLFSFLSHSWFLYGLHTLAFPSSAPSTLSAWEKAKILPYFWGFLAALIIPLLTNSIVMLHTLPPLRKMDPDFNLWAVTHRWSFLSASFLGLFVVGNVAVVCSPVWGPAPMTRVTRTSLAASGVIGSVMEVPRLAIQITLAVLYQATWAVALPLLLGSLFMLSGLLQRTYYLGYVKGADKRGVQMGVHHNNY